MDEPLSVQLFVGGRRGEALRCHQVAGSEAVNDLFELELDVSTSLDPDQMGALLGEPARVVWSLKEARRVVHGIVSSIATTGRRWSSRRHDWTYLLVVSPRAWLGTLRRTTRIFEERRVDDIIRTVLASYGVPTRWHIERSLPVRDYTTQYDESDWQFLRRLAADHGLSFYFEHPEVPDGDLFDDVANLIGAAVGVAKDLAGAALGANVEAMIDPVAAAGPIREVLVFTDSAHGYLDLGRPRPWNVVAGAVSTALEHLGVPSAVSDAVGVVGDLARDAISDALGLAASEESVLHFKPASGSLSGSDRDVLTFTDSHVITARRTTFRHYDPRRPGNALESTCNEPSSIVSAARGLLEDPTNPEVWRAAAKEGIDQVRALESGVDPMGALQSGLGQIGDLVRRPERPFQPLEEYRHHGRQPAPDRAWGEHEARRMMNRARRRRHTGTGTTRCPWLVAGHRFQLRGHYVSALDRKWVVVSIRHRLAPSDRDGRDGEVYTNEIQCIPADVHYPPAPSERRFVHAVETAKVVGSSELSTNDLAQIRVRFHWDREEHKTCWLRVMQPWAGAGWGAQFIPRVGSEVVVGFEGGDPDMPLVLGCLYNGANRPAFRLPAEQTKSGFRTKSFSGDGEKRNELYFDDASGNEKVFLRAEKDWEVEVLHDRHARVAHDDRTHISHERHLTVEGATHERHGSHREVEVRGDARSHVFGACTRLVDGDSRSRVAGNLGVVVEGAERRDVHGSSMLMAHGNVVERVAGSHTLVVGGEGSRTAATQVTGSLLSSATERIALSADQTLTLSCGDSRIVLSSDRIEIVSPTVLVRGEDARIKAGNGKIKLKADSLIQGMAETVALSGSGAAIGLTSEASVDGSRVLLNSPSDATDPVQDEEDEPTIIELRDQNGQPIPNHPFRIVFSDGSEQSGALDGEGRAELDLDRGGDIIFPGLSEVERS